MHRSLFSSGRQDVSTTFAYSQSVVLHVNSVVCQYLSIYKVFELLVENSLASKPNVWLARFDLLRQISYRVETLLESFLDYYWMKQFLSPSLFMCKCCFFNFRQRGDCHFNNLLAWIVLKIKEDVRHSILYHLFDCLPKSEFILTNSKTMNTAYCFAIFHLKNKIIKTNIQRISS